MLSCFTIFRAKGFLGFLVDWREEPKRFVIGTPLIPIYLSMQFLYIITPLISIYLSMQFLYIIAVMNCLAMSE